MNAKHGLSLQKSSKKHKVEGKNQSLKQAPSECKEDFVPQRNKNASKSKHNIFCNEENIPEGKL